MVVSVKKVIWYVKNERLNGEFEIKGDNCDGFKVKKVLLIPISNPTLNM